MSNVKDYYEALGVSRDATSKEIKSAFRKLARKHHPDANPGDPDADRRFKEISQAQDVLSDPDKRRLYDLYGADWEAAQQAGAGAGGASGARGPGGSRVRYQTIDPQEFERLFGGMGGAGGAGAGGFGDLFSSLFAEAGEAGPRRGGRASSAPLDAEGDVEVSLQEAFAGTSRLVAMPDGRRIEVSVPAGVQDGTVLRVPGLRARIHVRRDPRFTREGKDLHVEVEVALKTALLGGEALVPTPKGTKVSLKVPAETQNGRRMRMRGLGMPDPRGGRPGDLYAEVRVRLPLPMDDHLRRLAGELPG